MFVKSAVIGLSALMIAGVASAQKVTEASQHGLLFRAVQHLVRIDRALPHVFVQHNPGLASPQTGKTSAKAVTKCRLHISRSATRPAAEVPVVRASRSVVL
jgi:hypothetical protein